MIDTVPKWLIIMMKEWRVLVRDRAGLLLLFAMPAALVIVITLVQDNVLRRTGALKIKGAVVDLDNTPISRTILDRLDAVDVLRIADMTGLGAGENGQAVQMVKDGTIQFYAVIPKGFSGAVVDSLRHRMEKALDGKGKDRENTAPLPEVVVYFDPVVSRMYQAVVTGAVRQAAAEVQSEQSIRQLTAALERQLRRRISEALGPLSSRMPTPLLPSLKDGAFSESMVSIKSQTVGQAEAARLPTAAQQNVPAWALFGMFFIVVPLSGALIIERQEGIMSRLLTMPVYRSSLLLGKLGAYVVVCLAQFVCVVLVGRWLLPLLGTDAFFIGGHIGAISLVTLCSALAATGYGIMLGALVNSSQQASVFGPVSIVIAAAVGGIMVPVFAMPPVMQTLSHLSPLSWSHEAYMVLLVRHGALADIWPHLCLLLAFFAATMGTAVMSLRPGR